MKMLWSKTVLLLILFDLCFFATVYGSVCDTSPCLNNGTCTEDANSSDGYRCTCFAGLAHPNCTDRDECRRTDICNNGTCVNTVGSFHCDCFRGFTDDRCNVVDACYAVSCLNGGTCHNLNDVNYECRCPVGFDPNTNCTDKNECDSPGLCKNNATCINTDGSYRCQCTSGFNGANCESDVDECRNNPCFAGNCSNVLGSYSCNCYEGYTGVNCDLVISTTNPSLLSTSKTSQTSTGSRVPSLSSNRSTTTEYSSSFSTTVSQGVNSPSSTVSTVGYSTLSKHTNSSSYSTVISTEKTSKSPAPSSTNAKRNASTTASIATTAALQKETFSFVNPSSAFSVSTNVQKSNNSLVPSVNNKPDDVTKTTQGKTELTGLLSSSMSFIDVIETSALTTWLYNTSSTKTDNLVTLTSGNSGLTDTISPSTFSSEASVVESSVPIANDSFRIVSSSFSTSFAISSSTADVLTHSSFETTAKVNSATATLKVETGPLTSSPTLPTDLSLRLTSRDVSSLPVITLSVSVSSTNSLVREPTLDNFNNHSDINGNFSTVTNTDKSSRTSSQQLGIIVGASVGGILIVAILILVLILMLKKRAKNMAIDPTPS